MLLTEAKVILTIGVGSGVPYLEEYLIVADKITIQEAEELTYLVENALTDKLKRLKEIFQKEMDALKVLRDEKIAKLREAGKDFKAISKVKIWFGKQADKIRASYRTAVAAAKAAASKAASMIRNVPKKGKIGAAVAAGTLASAGGYAAYKAHKRRKAAMSKKK